MQSIARWLGILGIVTMAQCGDHIIGPPPEPLRHESDEEGSIAHGGELPRSPTRENLDVGKPLPGEAPIPWEHPPYVTVPPLGTGHALFLHPEDHRFRRLKVSTGSAPEALHLELDELSPGEDTRMAMSRDGRWLVAETTRLGCQADPCVAVFPADLSRGERVRVRGRPLRVGASTLAIGAEGRLIVYGASSGPHGSELFSIVRTEAGWSDARDLSAASPFDFNQRPSLSPDSRRVVFDCGQDPSGSENTAICEAAVDGTGFRVLRQPEGISTLHSASYAPDGSLVFERESEAEGKQIWRMSADGADEAPVNASLRDDRTPCVLPGGDILSLFSRRPGNPQGFRELKRMSASGKELGYLLTGVDIGDIGISCGN